MQYLARPAGKPQSSVLRRTMWVEILLAVAVILVYFYWVCTRQFDEFKKRGIPFAKPR